MIAYRLISALPLPRPFQEAILDLVQPTVTPIGLITFNARVMRQVLCTVTM